MADQVEWVNLTIWRADAIVLYDWLMETDLNAVPITHRAEAGTYGSAHVP